MLHCNLNWPVWCPRRLWRPFNWCSLYPYTMSLCDLFAGLFIMLFPDCCWVWLGEAKAGWCDVFHGLARVIPFSDVKYICADIKIHSQSHKDFSWRCDYVHVEVTLSRSGNFWQQATQRWRWPGKSGAFPSILQRQRDVRGQWPFPANQRQILGEERTTPSTSAQAVMRFPCLCWPVTAWTYLYPLWQKTGWKRPTGKLHQSSLFWVHFLFIDDV